VLLLIESLLERDELVVAHDDVGGGDEGLAEA
jgi:hypothetical protein